MRYDVYMKKIIIREPKVEEYEEIVRVLRSETALWNKNVFTEEELKLLEVGEDKVEYLIEGAKTRKYLIAIVDGRIVGFLAWRIAKNGIGWVSRSATLPDYYRKGIGRALNQEVERQAMEMGLAAIMKETQKKATWAVEFHLANGYKILSQDEVDEPPFKGVLNGPIVPSSIVFGKRAKDFCK